MKSYRILIISSIVLVGLILVANPLIGADTIAEAATNTQLGQQAWSLKDYITVFGFILTLVSIYIGIYQFRKEYNQKHAHMLTELRAAENRITHQFNLGLKKEKLETFSEYLALFDPDDNLVILAYKQGKYLEGNQHQRLEQKLLLLIDAEEENLIGLIKRFSSLEKKGMKFPEWNIAIREEVSVYCQKLLNSIKENT